MNAHYILDANNNPVAEPDLMAWATWYQDADRTVARSEFTLGNSGITVSTVFLSLPHINKHLSIDDVMLYETMVFADEAIIQRIVELSESDDRSIVSMFLGGFDIQIRYATRDEAVAGHKRLCTFIETVIGSGQLQPIDSEVTE